MKFLFSRMSIKNKIISVVMLIVILVLSIGFGIDFRKDISWYKKDLLSNTMVNTQLIGEYCISPLFFQDKQGAIDILSKLKSIPNFINAELYDQNAELFASYSLVNDSFTLTSISQESTYSFESHFLIVQEPLIFNNQVNGILVLRVSTQALNEKISQLYTAMAVILLVLFVFTYFLANSFQKFISSPILKLAYLSKEITEKSDYSLRINTSSHDEIGQLYKNFNTMLEQLHKREIERDKAEKGLKEAKDKAEQADKLKTAFLANMSHEIRTPMNSIIGFSGLLAEEELSLDKKREYVELITNSGNSLLNLVDDIIDISKIEAEQININKSESNIGSILNELYVSFSEKMSIKKKNVELIYKKTSELENQTIITDPYRFRQVVSNLINNATKFTDNGFIEFGVHSIDNDVITFFVRDTGIGVPEDKQEVIFDRFRKVDDDKAKLYRGAGLGLTICKKLVNLLGGNIWLQSKKGEGSTFFFTLPNQKGRGVYKDPTYEIKVSKKYDFSGKHILIAEDEEYNYLLVREVLKKTKVEVYWAKNGIEAIDLFKKNTIDLVLMDIKMPEMNGYEATVEIKKLNDKIPVIAQTAYAMTVEREKSYEVGCDGYLAKPINPKELLSLVDKFLYLDS